MCASRNDVLLCKNEIGYKNLTALVSKAWTEGFYSKPRVDRELLKKHSGGLIALSACLAGEIPKALLRKDYEKAKETALFYIDAFGKDNFFLEIQDHGIEEQQKINPMLIRLSKETGIPVHIADRPLECVALGTGISLETPELWNAISR